MNGKKKIYLKACCVMHAMYAFNKHEQKPFYMVIHELWHCGCCWKSQSKKKYKKASPSSSILSQYGTVQYGPSHLFCEKGTLLVSFC